MKLFETLPKTSSGFRMVEQPHLAKRNAEDRGFQIMQFFSRFPMRTAAAAALLAIMPGVAKAAVVFDYMSLYAESYMTSDWYAYSASDWEIDGKLSFENSAVATSAASLNRPGASLSASSTVTGSFTSEAEGSVAFSPQTVSMEITDPARLGAFALANGEFDYQFTLTTDMFLNYAHAISIEGDNFGTFPIGQRVMITPPYASAAYLDYILGEGSAADSMLLAAGSYQLRIIGWGYNYSNFESSAGSNMSSMNALFNYSFTDTPSPILVPEPSTLTGLIAGAVMLAVTLRRRRRHAAT